MDNMAIDLIPAQLSEFLQTKKERKGTEIRENIPPRWVDKSVQRGEKRRKKEVQNVSSL